MTSSDAVPRIAEDAVRRGLDLAGQGKPAEAVSAFGDAVAAAPDWPAPYVELARVWYRVGRFEDALKACGAALARDADHSGALTCCARILLAQRRNADAAVAAARAAELSADIAASHALLALAQLRTGAAGSAAATARRAMNQDPAHPDTIATLFLALAQGHQPDDAIRWGRRALALDRNRKPVIVELANQLRQRGDTGGAARLFDEARRRFPDDAILGHQVAAVLGETTARAPAGYVEAVFDGYADRFDAHLVDTLSYRAHDLVADALAHVLRPGGADVPDGGFTILDAGCGTGLCGARIRPWAQRLVGVDLSAGMLARARDRGVYDALYRADLITFLEDCDERFDAIVSADVLCYLGDLDPVFAAAAAALSAGGILVMTVEAMDGTGYGLTPSGRYCHSLEHLRRRSAGRLRIRSLGEAVLRTEANRPVRGFIGVFERRSTPPAGTGAPPRPAPSAAGRGRGARC